MTGFETSSIAAAQDFLAVIGCKHHFASEDINELVRVGVPVPLTGPCSRWQPQQINSKLSQPSRVAKRLALGSPALLVKWRWV